MEQADVGSRGWTGRRSGAFGVRLDLAEVEFLGARKRPLVARGGSVDYEECGAGPTIVLVPGSCSTTSAWRPVVSELEYRYKCVTTSLLGYGGTTERRRASDPSIEHECEALEAVVKKAGGRVHLVGHSFGGLVALAVALRGNVALSSLTIVEAPAAELLRERGEHAHYQAFRELVSRYFADYAAGKPEAIAAVMDFYGGDGTFASWPARARAYAVETTPVNMLDWASAYGFPLSAAALSAIAVPTSICMGATSHPAVQRANELLAECIDGSNLLTIHGANHFMTATHPQQVAHVIAAQVREAEMLRRLV